MTPSSDRETRSAAMQVALALLVAAAAVAAVVVNNPGLARPHSVSLFDSGTLEVSRFDVQAARSSEIPDLPFDDNPDPTLCGIPVPWSGGSEAWLSGVYEGELIQPTVLVYDSHLRLEIAGRAPHGTKVEVLLYQANPALDYYLVDLPGEGPPGWIPAPFLSFEEIPEGA